VTKPGQSQTVNIARTIPTVSSAALFRPEAIKQILSAAWGTISNHKDTELSIEASHWYAKGAGKVPAGKSYSEMTIPPKCSALPRHTLCHIADSFATRARGRWLLAASKKQRRSDSPATGRRTSWN